jgi:protein-S-isoprenylcysteine O-methyltransferase Ste14
VILVVVLSGINLFVLPGLITHYNPVVFGFGIALIITGVPVLIAALAQVHSAFGKGELVTNGVYAYMRDPVYAVWILFIVPGALLATGILLLAIAPFLMYWLLKTLIGAEETYLEMTFGKKYLDYKNRVNSVVPKLARKTEG